MIEGRKERIIIFVLVAFIIGITSVGYAFSDALLSISGDATIIGTDTLYEEGIETTDLVIDSYDENASYSTLNSFSYTSTRVTSGVKIDTEMDVTLLANDEFEVVAHLKNNSSSSYTYSNVNISNDFTLYGETKEIKNPRIYGILKGDVIGPGETKDVRIIYYADIDTTNWVSYSLKANIIFNFLIGSKSLTDVTMLTEIDDSESQFDSNNIAVVKVNVKNLYNTSYDVGFEVSGSNIYIMNSSSKKIALLGEGEEKTISLQIKAKETPTEDITETLFIYEGTKNARNIGTFTIKPYDDSSGDSGSSEVVVLSNVSITPTFTRTYGTAGKLSFAITNNNDIEYLEYLLKVYYNSTADLSLESYNQNITTLYSDDGLLTVSSEKNYNHGSHWTIGANQITTVELYVNTNHQLSSNDYGGAIYEDLSISKITLDVKLPDGTWSYDNTVYEQ